MKDMNVEHSDEASRILCQLGLFQENDVSGSIEPAHDTLRAQKHYPPAINEGPMSPCCGRLFAATSSSQNVKICTGYHASRYLAKYCASIDQVNTVFVGAVPNTQKAIQLRQKLLANTKITSSKINEEKRMQNQRDKHHPQGRAISLMEMISVALGYDQVYTDIQFVHIPTTPLAERPAFD